MRNELIEYHRVAANRWKAHVGDSDLDAAFHKRAVAWLESLAEDEGLAISAAAETQIQRENAKQ